MTTPATATKTRRSAACVEVLRSRGESVAWLIWKRPWRFPVVDSSGCSPLSSSIFLSPLHPTSPPQLIFDISSPPPFISQQPPTIQAVQMLRIHRPHPSGLPSVVARGDPRRRPVRALLDEIQIRPPVRVRHPRPHPVPRGLLSHPA